MSRLFKNIGHFFRVIFGYKFEKIGKSLSGRLTARPQFKVIDPIVASHPVFMMDRFVPKKRTFEVFCHD